MRRDKYILALLLILFSPVISPVHAGVCFYETQDGLQCATGIDDDPTCKSRCDLNDVCQNYSFKSEQTTCPPPPTRLENPIRSQGGGQISVPLFIGQIVSGSLALVGALTLLVFIYGGFLWLTSAGNEEWVKKGTKTMLYAAIGLFIIFASYGILRAIISALTQG
jgi:hypothetical protein